LDSLSRDLDLNAFAIATEAVNLWQSLKLSPDERYQRVVLVHQDRLCFKVLGNNTSQILCALMHSLRLSSLGHHHRHECSSQTRTYARSNFCIAPLAPRRIVRRRVRTYVDICPPHDSKLISIVLQETTENCIPREIVLICDAFGCRRLTSVLAEYSLTFSC
jgi:hypothetical protein